jgi:putative hydrolase of the HAD superfamily
MQIRAVIFDFGNVLCFHPSPKRIEDAARVCGLTASEFVAAFWANRWHYDRGQDPMDYWRGVAALANKTFDDALIAELITHEVGFWSTFDDRVLNWSDQLRRAGIPTGILSNLPHPLAKGLRETPGFLDHFDHITFSCDVGFAKPEPEIYMHSFEGLQVRPEEGLFLDDRPENVEGARKVGLQTVLFGSWEDFLQHDLPKYALPHPPK